MVYVRDLVYIVALFIATVGGMWVIRFGVRSFHTQDLPSGFENAGKYIGVLERFLIFLFLTLNQMSLIGFLLTSKAIYRYGDIQGDNTLKMKLSEYFLIGTLLSVSWVVLIYFAYQFIAQLF